MGHKHKENFCGKTWIQEGDTSGCVVKKSLMWAATLSQVKTGVFQEKLDGLENALQEIEGVFVVAKNFNAKAME